MQKLMLLMLLLTGIPVLAQNEFNGTWRMNTNDAQLHEKERMFLKDGLYDCYTCDPPVKNFKADGQPHSTMGSPYFDSVTVRVVDDRTVEFTSTKNGKPAGHSTFTVAGDNKTATEDETFYSENGQQNHLTDLLKRVEDGPAGANKISGTWQPDKIENASESITKITFKVTDEGLIMHDGQGDSYEAKFDGKDYPYSGDPGITTVSLKKIDNNTIQETDKRDGKLITVARMTVEPDGKTMKISIDDKIHNATMNFTANKE
jgi:hypothetical protein